MNDLEKDVEAIKKDLAYWRTAHLTLQEQFMRLHLDYYNHLKKED
jgi:hypothetical protein